MLPNPEVLEQTRDLDPADFWAENEQCFKFTTAKPRCPLNFSPDDHWLFEFLDVPSTVRYYRDKYYRDNLHKQANRLLIQYVGRSYFDEDTWATSPKRIENLFGCEFAYHEGSTPWLVPATDDPVDFSRILDRVEGINLSEWTLPEDFCAEWARRKTEGKHLPSLGTGSRGPATVMTSVLKPETFFYWTIDHPDLLRRFRDLLAEKMVELNQVLRAFSGNNETGWWITDDNCALYNRLLYHEYCYPVLETVLDELAPNGAHRYQHSDSAMGHLIDQQYSLGIRAVNYGPTVMAGYIREKMPDAWICGQLPPLLLRNGSLEAVRQHVISDFLQAGGSGGLEITTAGSLAAGTGLDRMRWLMKVVKEECRYH